MGRGGGGLSLDLLSGGAFETSKCKWKEPKEARFWRFERLGLDS